MATSRKGMPQRTYGEIDRRRACLAVLITGCTEKASAQLDIPARTIRAWRQHPSWEEHLVAVRNQYDSELEEKLGAVIRKALGEVEDRLTHGDFILNRKGELIRKPVGAKDASVVAGVFFDKQRLIRNQPTSIKGNSDQRLTELLNKFGDLGRRLQEKQIEGGVVAVEIDG